MQHIPRVIHKYPTENVSVQSPHQSARQHRLQYGKIASYARPVQKHESDNASLTTMQLSPHDLSQLDDTSLAGLEEGPLRVLSVKLLADLKEAHERLAQNPTNSSRPPSSRVPWEAEAPADEDKGDNTRPAGSPKGGSGGDEQETGSPPQSTESDPPTENTTPGRPGRRPGAPGHGRTQCLAIHEERHHHPEVCAVCGGPLSVADDERVDSAHFVIDLITPASGRTGLEAVQIKQVYFARRCGCGHWTRAEPAEGGVEEGWTVALSERHLAGPLLVALICALSLRMRLSRRRIREFLADWLGLSLSIASINQCLHEAGRAVAPVVEEQVLAEVRASDLLHADETSWKEHGTLVWLWVFTTTTTTLFVIGRRSRELLQSVLGTVLQGWLMSDGYWAYRDYDNRLRCLAHLVRKARGLEESLDGVARRFGLALHGHLEAIMAAVYAAREGPPPTGLRAHHAEALNALFEMCLQHAEARHAKTRALARELLNDWDTFWVVLDHPELPLTNNAAERALRHWVIARRISYGTRTRQGSRAFTALASVIDTCRQRGLSPWEYIAEVVRQRRQGNTAPALPATVAP